ncbi:helix-turn-helix domain-containing protein [Leadbettera azotonutricia]|uniref:helix-turn-helix domain-containing protein n=1 Tax=Leadbettera azotonutricia TaxID=150829 RepID=UPI001FE1A986|nr:helix-turn-helix domain-containing protein [Leadbettera azotonutricia]
MANICGVVNQTAINWIKNGYLKAFTTPGGQYRIYAKDLAAFLDKRGMGDSGEALQVLMEQANWDTLLIASNDEALNNRLKEQINGLLPNYEILQAFDGFDAGRQLAEEKPGFVLLDAALPGVDPSKLIRTVKEEVVFGKPFVFVMGTPGASIPDTADASFAKPPDLSKLAETIVSLEKQQQSAAIA